MAKHSQDPSDTETHTGLVLSGGGARGAYEAGVLAGIVEVLADSGRTSAPFDVFCGTSVGALNAAFLAAHADVPDMGVPAMLDHWRGLDINKHLRVDLRGMLGWKRAPQRRPGDSSLPPRQLLGRSLLDPRPLDELARSIVPWERLHRNVDKGLVRAMVLAALHVATGRTTVFAELAPGVHYSASTDPRRVPAFGRISAEHVVASGAIPLLFPARELDGEYYCDGGIRFNTPIAPAIRSGASRLVVVSLLSEMDPGAGSTLDPEIREQAYQSPIYLLGKVLNALLLDPIQYDLQVMDRFNRLWFTLEECLEPAELARVQHVISEARGLPYRKLSRLVFRPSQDIGHLARLRTERIQTDRFSSWLLAKAANLGTMWESDMLSFVLFDGEFAAQLIELGLHDVRQRADEVWTFFHSSADDLALEGAAEAKIHRPAQRADGEERYALETGNAAASPHEYERQGDETG